MDNIAPFLPITKKQLILIVVYVVILASIPLSFTLLKSTQIFKSGASGKDIPLIDSKSTITREVPSSSPLDDLKSQLEGTGSPTPRPTSAPSTGISFGPTLTFKINMEGRPSTNQAGKVFVGLGAGTVTTKPTYVLTFSVDVPANGTFSGLSLAGLTTGSTYTAYLKGPGQVDSAVTFTMSPSETQLNGNQAVFLTSGDVNEDNIVDSLDYTVVKNLYGSTPTQSTWNPRADFNGDGAINNWDLAYVTKNNGKIGASGIWYSRVSGSATNSATIAPYSEGTPSSFPGSQGGGYENSRGYEGSSGTSPSIPRSSGYWIWLPN